MATETIIESFCERCGTRYTFEPVRKRQSKLVGIGKSLGILPGDRTATLASGDPFHGTFHFCLECRQYTCPTCWNEEAGFCQACRPLPDPPDLFENDAAEAAATLEAISWADAAHDQPEALSNPSAWPDADLDPRRQPVKRVAPAATGAVASILLVDETFPVTDVDSWSLTFEPHAPASDVDLDAFGHAPTTTRSHDDADGDPAADVVIALGAATLMAAGSDAQPADAQPSAESTAAVDAETRVGAAMRPEAEANLEAGAQASEPPAGMWPGVEAEAVTDVHAESELEAAAVPEPEAAAEAVADDVAEPMALAEPDAVAETIAVAIAQTVVLAEMRVRPDASVDPDREADRAHLLEHLPVTDMDADDDGSAMAPALGRDIAPASLLVLAPVVPPVPPAVSARAWQLTAPVPDGEQRSATWPPMGPVFRPTPSPAPVRTTPHPAVLAPRAVANRAPARGHAHAAVPAQMPKGVRPCTNCELPLSASARFCRRCGRPQG